MAKILICPNKYVQGAGEMGKIAQKSPCLGINPIRRSLKGRKILSKPNHGSPESPITDEQIGAIADQQNRDIAIRRRFQRAADFRLCFGLHKIIRRPANPKSGILFQSHALPDFQFRTKSLDA